MNTNQINGVIRAVVPAILAYFIASGKLPDTAVADVTAGLVAIVAAIAAAWSIWTNTNHAAVATVQALPAAQVLVSDTKLLSPGVELVAPSRTVDKS